jgi:chromosome segregation ATPase
MRKRTEPDPRRELEVIEGDVLAAQKRIADGWASLAVLLGRKEELEFAVARLDAMAQAIAEFERQAEEQEAAARDADGRARERVHQGERIVVRPNRLGEIESVIVKLADEYAATDRSLDDAIMAGASRREIEKIEKRLAKLRDELSTAESNRDGLLQSVADRDRLLAEAEAERAKAEELHADAERLRACAEAVPEAARRVAREQHQHEQHVKNLGPPPKPKLPDSSELLVYQSSPGEWRDSLGRAYTSTGIPKF